LVEVDEEFLAASERSVVLLDESNEVGDMPLSVIVPGVADEKIEMESLRHKNDWEVSRPFSSCSWL
jgi:hypothetical protein